MQSYIASSCLLSVSSLLLQKHMSEHHPRTFQAHNVVAGSSDSCANLPIETRQTDGRQPCRDVCGVIRSPSDSYSESEIVIIALPQSPEGVNTVPVSCCSERQPKTHRAAAWCLFLRGNG